MSSAIAPALTRLRGPDRPALAGRGSRRKGWTGHSVGMTEEFVVTCPYCAEEIEIRIEADVHGSFVQDCEVCCNPWTVRVEYEAGDRYVSVARADGSE